MSEELLTGLRRSKKVFSNTAQWPHFRLHAVLIIQHSLGRPRREKQQGLTTTGYRPFTFAKSGSCCSRLSYPERDRSTFCTASDRGSSNIRTSSRPTTAPLSSFLVVRLLVRDSNIWQNLTARSPTIRRST